MPSALCTAALDELPTDPKDQSKMRVDIFYSISLTKPGLQGVEWGTFLII